MAPSRFHIGAFRLEETANVVRGSRALASLVGGLTLRARPSTGLHPLAAVSCDRSKRANFNHVPSQQQQRTLNTTGPKSIATISRRHGSERVSYTIAQQKGGSIATITISKPNKLNTLDTATLDQLIEKSNTLAQYANLRAVVLTGAPPAPGKTQPSSATPTSKKCTP